MLLYLFLALILIMSCSKQSEDPKKAAPTIDQLSERLTSCFQEADYMEDIFQTDTLRLRTPSRITSSIIRSIHFTKNGNIYLGTCTGHVLKFSRTGQLMQTIGRDGKGPGEYIRACYVNTNSRNELIVGDIGQNKITILDENAKFLSSFWVPDFFDGLFISPEDQIIIHDIFNGRRLQRETIYVYERNGELIQKFGRVSEIGSKLKDVPFLPQANGYLAVHGNDIFEADYPDYKIRKYNMEGQLLKEFGSKPKDWRSPLDSGYEKLPPPQMITPAIQKKLLDFFEEFRKYPMVHWITNFRPGIVAMMIKPSASPSGGKDTYFVSYDVQGNLLSSGLCFQNLFQENEDLETAIISSTPEGFCVIQYDAQDAGMVLIRFRFKGDCL